MANRYIIKVDGVQQKEIKLEADLAGLPDGSHTLTVEKYQDTTLLESATRNFTVGTGTTTIPEAPSFARKLPSAAGELVFEWGAVSNATHYNINIAYYDANWVLVQVANIDVTGTTHTITNAVNAEYNIDIKAVNSAGASPVKNVYAASGTVFAPTITVGTITTTSIALSWSGGTGASFELFQAAPDGTETKVHTSTSGSGSFTAINLTPGTRYSYYMIAKNTSGYRHWGQSVAATTTTDTGATLPGVPPNFRSTSQTETTIALAWDAATNADTYSVLIKRPSETAFSVLVSGLTTLSFNVQQLLMGTQYSFRIRAVNVNGQTETADLAVSTLTSAPQPPTNLRVVSKTETSVELAWDAAKWANTYDVRIKGGSTVSYVNAATGLTVLTYTKGALTAGTEYGFQIRAVNQYGSTLGTELFVTTNSSGVVTLDPDYQAVLDYATTNAIPHPSAATQSVHDQKIKDLKAAGIFQKTDFCYYFGGDAPVGFKLICWKRKVQGGAHGSPTWDAAGVRGNAANAYVSTGYNPSANGVNWTPNSAGVHYYANVDVVGVKMVYAATDTANNTSCLSHKTGNTSTVQYCDINGGILTIPLIARVGVNSQNRTDAATIVFRGNGVETAALSSQGANTNANLTFLCRNNKGSMSNYSDEGLRWMMGGGPLTATEFTAAEGILT